MTDPSTTRPRPCSASAEADRQVAELDGEPRGARVRVEPVAHAATEVHDLLEVRAVDGQVEGDGVAERRVGPQLPRLGEADLGLGVEDLGDDLHRVGEA